MHAPATLLIDLKTEVNQQFRHTDTAEIIARIRNRTLTGKALQVAAGELSFRGFAAGEVAALLRSTVGEEIAVVSDAPRAPTTRKAESENEVVKYLAMAWHGELELRLTFWIGYLIWLLCFYLVLAAVDYTNASSAVTRLAVALITIPWAECVWQCAFNVQRDIWGYAARALVLALVAGFLAAFLN